MRECSFAPVLHSGELQGGQDEVLVMHLSERRATMKTLTLETISLALALLVISLAGPAYTQAYPEGLVFWNKLGSQTEIENSEVGLDGTFGGGGFVTGMFGNAFSADYTQDSLVRFPKEVIPTYAGCIEFWAKLVDPPPNIQTLGSSPLFVHIDDGYARYRIDLNGNDGYGAGGVTGAAGYVYDTGTGPDGFWTYEQVLGAGQVEEWHHYALVWDENGIAGVDDGTKRVAVFLDGQLESGYWYTAGVPEFVPLTSGELLVIANHNVQGSAAIDNIKIWDYSKTNFSDRFVEGFTLLALSPSSITTYYPCDDSYSLELLVHDVAYLGAFEVCTGFDSSVVTFEGVTVDTFLGSTGRDVYPLDPIACEPSCQMAGMRYGAWSLGAEDGPSGSGTLERISFSKSTSGPGTDTLCLENWEIVNTELPPAIIETVVATGAVVIHRPFCYGDFNDDGDITVVDIMQVSSRWGCCDGDPCYSDTFDVNLIEQDNYCASSPDSCIDIVDVQTVAGRWGQGCPTSGMPLIPRLAEAPHSTPVVRIWPESLTICCSEGETASFDIVVEDGYDLGAFEFHISFDPSVVRVEDIQVGELPSSTGRSAYPVGPRIDGDGGRVSFGAWTLGTGGGVSGDGSLARVTVSIQSCDATTGVSLTRATLTNAYGWPESVVEMYGGWIKTDCSSAGESEVEPAMPKAFALYPGRPNPLNSSTSITFAIPGSSASPVPVEVVIYSVSGQVVRKVVDRRCGPGYHHVEWDGRDTEGQLAAPGVYFCCMKAGDYTQTRRVAVVR
jgi:hypothetical protein